MRIDEVAMGAEQQDTLARLRALRDKADVVTAMDTAEDVADLLADALSLLITEREAGSGASEGARTGATERPELDAIVPPTAPDEGARVFSLWDELLLHEWAIERMAGSTPRGVARQEATLRLLQSHAALRRQVAELEQQRDKAAMREARLTDGLVDARSRLMTQRAAEVEGVVVDDSETGLAVWLPSGTYPIGTKVAVRPLEGES